MTSVPLLDNGLVLRRPAAEVRTGCPTEKLQPRGRTGLQPGPPRRRMQTRRGAGSRMDDQARLAFAAALRS